MSIDYFYLTETSLLELLSLSKEWFSESGGLAYLQSDTVSRSSVKKFVRARQIVDEWFGADHVFSSLKCGKNVIGMERIWGVDRDNLYIGVLQNFLVGIGNENPMLRGDFAPLYGG
jgi:hypothetical protein